MSEEEKKPSAVAPEAETTPTTEEAEGQTTDAAAKPRIGKKILLIVIPIIVLILIIIGYFIFSKRSNPAESTSKTDDKLGAHNSDVFKGDASNQNFFIDLEDFVVDLSSHDNRPSFLKLSLTLNLYKEAEVAAVNSKLPIIRDNFQLYLRELREADLNGSGGMYRLKEELLIRLNKILYPVQVKDILFREILIR